MNEIAIAMAAASTALKYVVSIGCVIGLAAWGLIHLIDWLFDVPWINEDED